MIRVRCPTYHEATEGGIGRAVLGAGLAVAGVLGLVTLRRWRPFRVEVTGESMAPGLLPGDYLLATAEGRVRPGALVVAEDPRTPGFELVKRVAAVPGEFAGGRALGPGEHWLLGDRPARSTDSRAFGPVRRESIKGVVRLRYWPPARFGLTG